MNKDVLKVIDEFSVILEMQPPYGEYYEGNIIDWIEEKFIEKEIEEIILLRRLILNTAKNYIVRNNNIVNQNVINAQIVCIHYESKIPKLRISEKYSAAQIIYLFKILHKKYNFFDNKTFEIEEFLHYAFDLGKENVRSRLIREATNKPPKQLFNKVSWEELEK